MKFLQDLSWLYSDPEHIAITVCSTLLIYLSVIIITRVNGLRTFAKMSSFDFAITIAIGSLIASIMLSPEQGVLQGVVALTILILLQAIIARLRKNSDWFEKIVSNTPVLLMEGPYILKDNLKSTGVTEADLYAKLRKANVSNFDQILAVILETTGDISVLHKGTSSESLDKKLLKYVVDKPQK